LSFSTNKNIRSLPSATRSQDNNAALAVVNRHRPQIVQDEEDAVLTILDYELLAVDFASALHQNGIFSVCEAIMTRRGPLFFPAKFWGRYGF
jgi:predicted nuclease with RNAse H fold